MWVWCVSSGVREQISQDLDVLRLNLQCSAVALHLSCSCSLETFHVQGSENRIWIETLRRTAQPYIFLVVTVSWKKTFLEELIIDFAVRCTKQKLQNHAPTNCLIHKILGSFYSPVLWGIQKIKYYILLVHTWLIGSLAQGQSAVEERDLSFEKTAIWVLKYMKINRVYISWRWGISMVVEA